MRIHQHVQKQSISQTLWAFQTQQRPYEAKRENNRRKRIGTTLYLKKGHIAIMLQEDKRTINVDWNVSVLFGCNLRSAFKEKIEVRSQKCSLKSLMHSAVDTFGVFLRSSVKLVSQPPLVMNLTRSDFFLFFYIMRYCLKPLKEP